MPVAPPSAGLSVGALLDRVYREEAGKLHAGLIRSLGSFDLAEDAVQDALTQALRRWPAEGVPDRPAAWLYATARNRALDRVRRASNFARKQPAIREHLDRPVPEVDVRFDGEIPDERLRLIFTCCHPALRVDAQIALTLRTLGGLTTPEIARAFLLPEATLAQRLVRAKRKIKQAAIPYRVPPPELLPERLEAVLHTLYLIFNEGYAASGGEALIRHHLCDEAIRLTAVLDALLPGTAEVEGLHALMRLHHARRAARLSEDDALIPLEEQDRGHWDHPRILAAAQQVERALRRPGAAGPYAIQAAIAALHCTADSAETTDWTQILGLYQVLHAIQPSPIVALNAAVALAMAEGPAQGLAALEDLAEPLADYPYLPAARADLLRRAGRRAQAAVAYREALAVCRTDPERRYLQRRLREVSAQSSA